MALKVGGPQVAGLNPEADGFRLDSIRITRAGNGFIVHQSKTYPSKERNWSGFDLVFTRHEDVADCIALLLQRWSAANPKERGA